MAAVNKADIVDALRCKLEEDLASLTESQRETQAGATHEEAKSEGDKDMRATEVSYLARGLAQRVVDLKSDVAKLASLQLRPFDEDSMVALTALVVLEDEEGEESLYFLSPVGGGERVEVGGRTIKILTQTSPLGRSVTGRELDDEIEVASPGGKRILTLVAMS